jgi:hypothetical protein
MVGAIIVIIIIIIIIIIVKVCIFCSVPLYVTSSRALTRTVQCLFWNEFRFNCFNMKSQLNSLFEFGYFNERVLCRHCIACREVVDGRYCLQICRVAASRQPPAASRQPTADSRQPTADMAGGFLQSPRQNAGHYT